MFEVELGFLNFFGGRGVLGVFDLLDGRSLRLSYDSSILKKLIYQFFCKCKLDRWLWSPFILENSCKQSIIVIK